MNIIEFDPKPVMGTSSNGVRMLFEIMSNQDSAWLIQSNSAMHGWGCPSGNGLFAALLQAKKNSGDEQDRQMLQGSEQMLKQVCAAVSEFVNKEYDLVFTQMVQKQKKVEVKVPKVRKVGLFKKEEYFVSEYRTETYNAAEDVCFKGWRLERLFRQEGSGSGAETLLMDYCLGADGKLYCIISKKEGNPGFYAMECITYSPLFLSSSFCNVYTAALSGVCGVMDAIPVDPDDPSRKVHITLDDEYYYNFPVQIDDHSQYPYNYLDGVLARLSSLLDEDGVKRCLEKYEWMKEYLK